MPYILKPSKGKARTIGKSAGEVQMDYGYKNVMSNLSGGSGGDRIPFANTVITVPMMLTAKKAPEFVNRISTPATKPSHAPTLGPYNAAPTTIGTNTRLRLKIPTGMITANDCNTTTMAVISPTPTIVFVFSLIC